jgi:hypothetical protein
MMHRVSIAFVMLPLFMGSGCQPSPTPSPSKPSTGSGVTSPAQASAAATIQPAASAPAQLVPTPAGKAAPGDTEKPDTAQPKPDDPRIEGIRAKYQEIRADQRLKKSEFGLTCAGGEGSGQVRLFEKNGAIQRAELHVTDAGHGEDTYHFYYDQGKVIFALYGAGAWSFAGGGTPEKPATKDSVTQFRYYYHDGNSILCIKKHAEGPTEKIGSLLEKAPNEPDDCSRAGKAQKLASSALLGPKARDELTKLMCP